MKKKTKKTWINLPILYNNLITNRLIRLALPRNYYYHYYLLPNGSSIYSNIRTKQKKTLLSKNEKKHHSLCWKENEENDNKKIK